MTSKSAITRSKVSRVSGLAYVPKAYMKKAIKWLLEHAAAALFLDPGLGKTGITLAALKVLFKQGMINRVLVIAPLRVCYSVWPREVEKWADFQHMKIGVLHGPEKEDVLRSDAEILVINPEGLQWLLAKEVFKHLKAEVLIVDESTRFKNSQSIRFKNLRGVIGKFRYRWILTGTPMSNGFLDLFAQLYIVDEGRALGRYITHYRNKYFDRTGFGGYTWELREGSERAIYRAIKPYALRLQAEDFLELPKVVEVNVTVDLPPKVRDIYESMENEAFAIIDEEGFGAGHAAAALNKCRQIANGALYRDDSKEFVSLHYEKCMALESLLEERNGRCTLVAYEFEHDYKQSEKYFGKKLPRIGGGVSAKEADKLVAKWNAGDLPVLLVHPASAGHGLNMQDCELADAIVWYGLTFDLELWDQLNRRLYRQGAKFKQMYIYRIIAANTVEYGMIRSIEKKDKKQKNFLQALKRYRTDKVTNRRSAK